MGKKQKDLPTRFFDCNFKDLQLKTDIHTAYTSALDNELEAQQVRARRSEEEIILNRLKYLKRTKDMKPELYALCVETLQCIFDKNWESEHKNDDYDIDSSIDIDL